MSIYTLLSFVSIILMTIEKILSKRVISFFLFYLLFILFVLLQGFRIETGTDWVPYFNHFQGYSDNTILFNDLGYNFFVKIFNFFDFPYTVFITLIATLFYYPIFKLIWNTSQNRFESIILLFSITLGIWGANRQLISLGFCFFALNAFLEGKNRLTALYIITGSLFHFSAIFSLLMVFTNRDFGILRYLILIISAIVFGIILQSLIKAIDYLQSFEILFHKLSVYTNDSFKISLLGIIKRLLIFFSSLFLIGNIEEKKSIVVFSNIYFFGILILLVFKDIAPIMINRGSLFFNIIECILVPHILFNSRIKVFQDIRFKILPYSIFVVYIFIMANQSVAMYPDLFHPYKSIFSNNFYRHLY